MPDSPVHFRTGTTFVGTLPREAVAMREIAGMVEIELEGAGYVYCRADVTGNYVWQESPFPMNVRRN